MMYGVFVGGQTPSLHVRLPRSSVTSTLVCDCKCSLEGIAFGWLLEPDFIRSLLYH
jgi:hypothetical protein